MDKNEKLIASVFDNAVTALGLMTNKLSDSIKAPMSDEQLRDHFAGLAMNGELSRIAYNGNGRTYSDFNDLAKKSYQIADAMLKARKEVKP